ncbi:DUF2510 domain-containing protein [Nocardia farcinica]|uniref:DUF2510 domain-containing protein n=1 Tax=Nocardia farcinica TaxID=37329 RepID=UPI0010C9D190
MRTYPRNCALRPPRRLVPDSGNPAFIRWFDGVQWTENVQPATLRRHRLRSDPGDYNRSGDAKCAPPRFEVGRISSGCQCLEVVEPSGRPAAVLNRRVVLNGQADVQVENGITLFSTVPCGMIVPLTRAVYRFPSARSSTSAPSHEAGPEPVTVRSDRWPHSCQTTGARPSTSPIPGPQRIW